MPLAIPSPVFQQSFSITNAQIKKLPSVSIVVIPATETPNYATSLVSIPVIVGGFIILSNYTIPYTGVNNDASFGFFLGSDTLIDIETANTVCRPIMRSAPNNIANGDAFAYLTPGLGLIYSLDANTSFIETTRPAAFTNNFYDNAIVFGMDNNGATDLGGGHVNNNIQITLLYTLANRL